MSNINSALMIRDKVIERDLQGKSQDELIRIKTEAEKREYNRIQNIDYDDCFVSSSIDQTTIAIINDLLDARIQRDFTNEVIRIENYTITILEANKEHYNIINKELKLDVDYYGCGYGKVTGKGARKYMDELEDLNKQIKKYISKNRFIA